MRFLVNEGRSQESQGHLLTLLEGQRPCLAFFASILLGARDLARISPPALSLRLRGQEKRKERRQREGCHPLRKGSGAFRLPWKSGIYNGAFNTCLLAPSGSGFYLWKVQAFGRKGPVLWVPTAGVHPTLPSFPPYAHLLPLIAQPSHQPPPPDWEQEDRRRLLDRLS